MFAQGRTQSKILRGKIQKCFQLEFVFTHTPKNFFYNATFSNVFYFSRGNFLLPLSEYPIGLTTFHTWILFDTAGMLWHGHLWRNELQHQATLTWYLSYLYQARTRHYQHKQRLPKTYRLVLQNSSDEYIRPLYRS